MADILFQKVQRLKEELLYMKQNSDRFLKSIKNSTDTRKIVERSVFLIAEAVLDIADLIIVNRGYPKASTYRDAVYKLGEYNVLPREFAYRFSYIAGLRNFLAHDYLRDTVPTLEDFLTTKLQDIEAFLAHLEHA